MKSIKRRFIGLFVVLLFASTLFSFHAFGKATQPPHANSADNNVTFESNVNPEYMQFLQDAQRGDISKYGQIYPSPVLRTAPTPELKKRSKTSFILPSTYDGRVLGTVSPVKHQGKLGTCWTFAGMAAAESSVIVNSFETRVFSEEHVRFYLSNQNPNSIYTRDPNEGGWDESAINYLMNEYGAVLSTHMPYDENNTEAPLNLYEPNLINTTFDGAKMIFFSDRESVKEEIMANGAVTVSYVWNPANYSSTGFALYNNSDYRNAQGNKILPSSTEMHASVIVGWDDTFSRNNFKSSNRPAADGAWLVKNSWGENMWGEVANDDGFFWMSYFDKTYINANPGRDGETVGFSLTKPKLFDGKIKIQSHDNSISGSSITSTGSSICAASVFEISQEDVNEYIVSDVRFFSETVQEYEIQIVQMEGNDLPAVNFDNGIFANGIANAGWQTVALGGGFQPSAGKYAIIIKFNNPDGKTIVSLEYGDTGLAAKVGAAPQIVPNLETGTCFFSNNNGSTWTDLRTHLTTSPILDTAVTKYMGHFLIKSVLRSKGDLPQAERPNITKQPVDITIPQGYPAEMLSVEAEAPVQYAGTRPCQGSLSYQWYKTTTHGNSGGTAIAGATKTTYTPPTNVVGEMYYYVLVTNRLFSTHAEEPSVSVTVTIEQLTNASPPTITLHPESGEIRIGESWVMFVEAEAPNESSVLSYKWYSNTESSTNHGTAIPSATASFFELQGATAKTTYIYVEVIATDNTKTGEKSASVFSDIVAITIHRIESTAQPTIRILDETVETVTHNSISIIGLPSASNGQKFEYGVSKLDDPLSVTEDMWQESWNFNELDSSSTYYIFARAKQNDVYSSGTPSIIAIVETDKESSFFGDNPEMIKYAAIGAAAILFIIVFASINPLKKKKKEIEDDDGDTKSILPSNTIFTRG